jgi:hypothetical protein
MEGPMMQIGGSNKDVADAVAEAVVKVATCSPVPEVAIAALETLRHLGETKNVSIMNCSFTAGSGGPNADKPPVAAVLVDGSEGDDEDSTE